MEGGFKMRYSIERRAKQKRTSTGVAVDALGAQNRFLIEELFFVKN